MKNKALILSLLMFAGNAMASDKVSSPNVTEGKLYLEYRGGYDFDEVDSRDHRQVNKFVVNYGATERLRTEMKLVTDNDPTKEMNLATIESSLRYQFWEPEEAWLSAAAEIGYRLATESGRPDRVEFKMLFAKSWDAFSAVSNLSLENDVGEDRRPGSTFKASVSGTYKIESYFAPGFEAYLDTGNLRDGNTFNEQRNTFGPVVYGKITDELKYDVGYLFGVSDNAPDGRIKLLLTYSMQF